MHVLALNLLDPHSLIQTFGTVGIAVILFAETGLLVGLFLPGDTLLFTAGLLASTEASSKVHLSLGFVLIAAVVGTLVGSQVGFVIGQRVGPPLLLNPNRPRVRDAVRRTEHFVARYGYGKALVLGRFIPLIRTAMSPLAGVLAVPTRTFTLWNIVGGLFWSLGVTLAGFALGSSVSNIDHYVLPIIAVIAIGSLLPVAFEARKARARAAERTH